MLTSCPWRRSFLGIHSVTSGVYVGEILEGGAFRRSHVLVAGRTHCTSSHFTRDGWIRTNSPVWLSTSRFNIIVQSLSFSAVGEHTSCHRWHSKLRFTSWQSVPLELCRIELPNSFDENTNIAELGRQGKSTRAHPRLRSLTLPKPH